MYVKPPVSTDLIPDVRDRDPNSVCVYRRPTVCE